MRPPCLASLSALAVALCIACLTLPTSVGAGTARVSGCAEPRANAWQSANLRKALPAGRDVLGESVLASSAGPTHARLRRLLPSLWYARGPDGTSLTRSGAHYLTFAQSASVYGVASFALHVADGSEIVTRRSGGPALTLFVGRKRELYGACLARLEGPRLAEGWLPILQTAYVDANGARYRQESFAGRIAGVRALVSFMRLTVDARPSGRTALVRFLPSRAGRGRLVHGVGGNFVGTELRFRVRETAVVHVAWIHGPEKHRFLLDENAYRKAREALRSFWERKQSDTMTMDVPDRRVVAAQRNALVQQRVLTWRYSVGNTYEELSFAEALDAARVTAAYGMLDVSEATIRFAARRIGPRYTNWRAGALLVAAASHAELGGSLPRPVERTLRSVLRRIERQVNRPGGTGLLEREQFSSDVRRSVTGLHGQAVVWQGLRAMSRMWARAERSRLAARAARAALRLEGALQRAIAASERRLPDGSLFVPAVLLEDARPFDRLTASRDGSYWNLVMPYVLSSGLLRPDGQRARGVWQYLSRRGGRLLGLVRARASTLYRRRSPHVSGVDQVYGLNVARFLADADMPDELALSLYGTLTGAMTPGTFVSGEAATVLPLGEARRGSMYLPPNGGTTTAFLETVRLALVHERRDARGAPIGLDLAFATPRHWLRPGATVALNSAPTSFGPVSYSIARAGDVVEVSVEPPHAPDVRLRLRLPVDRRIASVESSGREVPFDAASGTIRLPRRPGPIDLVVRLGS